MLTQLDIHNVALIDRVSMELGEGLNILTGETGAGKSIIIDSINAILGERVSRDLIRTGTDRALVEAVFQVDNGRFADIFTDMGIEPEEDGSLILSREITQSGRNTCRVNGKLATVSMLKNFGERLIDMHGQYDNQSLLKTDKHLQLLDSFGGNVIQTLKSRFLELYDEYRTIKTKLKEISGEHGERERKIDLLNFQIDEIAKARLENGEEEELNRQRELLANSEKIINSLACAYELLFSGNNIKNSAHDNINESLSEISSITRLDEKFESIHKRLSDITYQLDDLVEELRKERDNTEYSPELLEEVEERLDLIHRLKRKYGSTIDEIQAYYGRTVQQLDEMLRSEETAAALNSRLLNIEEELYKTAQSLNKERIKAAKMLEGKIGDELEDLEMKGAQFKVEIRFEDGREADGDRKFTKNGLDRVEFLISPNVGEPLKPLAKIASGGEMSRVMLAIKTILADVDEIPTLIFDEIDIGISGKASQKVGEKLSYISGNHQVICVTHLAQIACMADSHFLIEKVSGDDSTETFVQRLSGDGIRNEMARLLGGSAVTETSRKYAGEILNNARKLKKAQKLK